MRNGYMSAAASSVLLVIAGVAITVVSIKVYKVYKVYKYIESKLNEKRDWS